MNKIDLIIECMDQILNDELPSPENMMKAYRYACELRELQPVAWMSQGGDASRSANYFKEMGFTNLIALYALDEDTK